MLSYCQLQMLLDTPQNHNKKRQVNFTGQVSRKGGVKILAKCGNGIQSKMYVDKLSS